MIARRDFLTLCQKWVVRFLILFIKMIWNLHLYNLGFMYLHTVLHALFTQHNVRPAQRIFIAYTVQLRITLPILVRPQKIRLEVK